VPTRQKYRFWMPATNRMVIIGGLPNGGSARGYSADFASFAARYWSTRKRST
jgi:hypothetical protein